MKRATLFAAAVAAAALGHGAGGDAFASTPGCSIGTPNICETVESCTSWEYSFNFFLGTVTRKCSSTVTLTKWWEPLGSGDDDDGSGDDLIVSPT